MRIFKDLKFISTLLLFVFSTAARAAFAHGTCEAALTSIAQSSQNTIAPDFFFKGRLNADDLLFEYRACQRMSEGVEIVAYFRDKSNPVAYISAGNWHEKGVPQIGVSAIKRDNSGVGSFQGLGLGSLLYVITAKLAFDKYNKPLGASYESRSEDAELLWTRLQKYGFATDIDGIGIFKENFLSSNQLNSIMEYFHLHSTVATQRLPRPYWNDPE